MPRFAAPQIMKMGLVLDDILLTAGEEGRSAMVSRTHPLVWPRRPRCTTDCRTL